jgi:hypothetical protein
VHLISFTVLSLPQLDEGHMVAAISASANGGHLPGAALGEHHGDGDESDDDDGDDHYSHYHSTVTPGLLFFCVAAISASAMVATYLVLLYGSAVGSVVVVFSAIASANRCGPSPRSMHGFCMWHQVI